MSVRPAVLTCLCLNSCRRPLTQATHIILLCLFRTLHVWSSSPCPYVTTALFNWRQLAECSPENGMNKSRNWCLSLAINVLSYCWLYCNHSFWQNTVVFSVVVKFFFFFLNVSVYNFLISYLIYLFIFLILIFKVLRNVLSFNFPIFTHHSHNLPNPVVSSMADFSE